MGNVVGDAWLGARYGIAQEWNKFLNSFQKNPSNGWALKNENGEVLSREIPTWEQDSRGKWITETRVQPNEPLITDLIREGIRQRASEGVTQTWEDVVNGNRSTDSDSYYPFLDSFMQGEYMNFLGAEKQKDRDYYSGQRKEERSWIDELWGKNRDEARYVLERKHGMQREQDTWRHGFNKELDDMDFYQDMAMKHQDFNDAAYLQREDHRTKLKMNQLDNDTDFNKTFVNAYAQMMDPARKLQALSGFVNMAR